MNRRGFFKWFRAAPVAVPLLITRGIDQSDGVSLDGKSFYLDGKKVMEQLPDGSVAIGPMGNIRLNGPKAALEMRDSSFFSKTLKGSS